MARCVNVHLFLCQVDVEGRKANVEMQVLLSSMQQSTVDQAGKQDLARLLWELLCTRATVGVSIGMAGLLSSSPDLLRSMSWALHAGAWAAAGIVQVLTHDSQR
jgi:hypothetical protein